MRVSFALIIWGETYVRDFLAFSLPTLLADGNLTNNPFIDGSRFQLYTTQNDLAVLETSPLFQRLRRTLPVEFIAIDTSETANKYHAVSRYHVDALRRSENHDAIVILYPDVVWARGSIRYAVERLAEGALAVFSPGPTVTPQAAKDAFATLGKVEGPDDAQTIVIEPQQLAGVVLDNCHPMWDGFDWDGNCFLNSSACLRWNVPGQGWLIRCFHLHPVILKIQRDNPMFFADFGISLDGEYVARLFDGLDRVAFATDTAQFAIVSLRSATEPPLPVPGNIASVTSIAHWAEHHAQLLHRSFVNIAFRWHRGNSDETAWQAAENRSQSIVDDIQRRLQAPDSIVYAEDPVAYRIRKGRHHALTAWRRPRVGLLPSQAQRPRIELARILASRMTVGFIWRTAGLIQHARMTRWLMRRPAIARLWLRVRPFFSPADQFEATVSSGSLLRGIIHKKDENRNAN